MGLAFLRLIAGAVADKELLYRRVKRQAGPQLCFKVEGNRTIFTAAAFNDPQKKPSVDRAALKIFRNPHRSRVTIDEGIVALGVEDVRRLGPFPEVDKKGRSIVEGKPVGEAYRVDVAPDPIFGNCAHALIAATPPTPAASNSVFNRMKEALARLANTTEWTVPPDAPIGKKRAGRLFDAAYCLITRPLR